MYVRARSISRIARFTIFLRYCAFVLKIFRSKIICFVSKDYSEEKSV